MSVEGTINQRSAAAEHWSRFVRDVAQGGRDADPGSCFEDLADGTRYFACPRSGHCPGWLCAWQPPVGLFPPGATWLLNKLRMANPAEPGEYMGTYNLMR